MRSFFDIIDKKGRINYSVLKDFIAVTPLTEFTEQAVFPFLIGSELYEGELQKNIGDKAASGTLRFQLAEIKEFMEKNKTVPDKTPERPQSQADYSVISRAIYYLHKKPGNYSTDEEKTTFHIGRADDNDIVIADYAISKHHAQIMLYRNMFFAMDLKSTNGTKVNLLPINPGMKVQLKIGSTVSFGRFCFIFTHPLQLYRGMRSEILGI